MDTFLGRLFRGYYNAERPEYRTGGVYDYAFEGDSIYVKPLPHFSDEARTRFMPHTNINTAIRSFITNDYYNSSYKPPMNVIDSDSVYTRPSRYYQEGDSLLEMLYNNMFNKDGS